MDLVSSQKLFLRQLIQLTVCLFAHTYFLVEDMLVFAIRRIQQVENANIMKI